MIAKTQGPLTACESLHISICLGTTEIAVEGVVRNISHANSSADATAPLSVGGCPQRVHVHLPCSSRALGAAFRLRRGAARLRIILSSMATGLRSPESQAEALASRLEGWTGLQGVVSSHLPDKAPEQVSIFMPTCLCILQ